MFNIRLYMDKIYTVTISFEDWECSSYNTVGFFSDKKMAEETMKKWEDFFEHHDKEIFNLQRDSNGNFESDEIEDEWYSRASKYEQIRSYSGVSIEEFSFNTDIFVTQTDSRSKEMQKLVRQWERDYKIKKIIDKNE
jgi:hypothetical protein